MIKGIIYAIVDDEFYYIGSTKQSLVERMELHMTSSKYPSHKYSKLYKYINEVRKGWKDILYITLEEVLCNTLRELETIEYYYIQQSIHDNKCLNILQNISQKHIIKYYKKK